MRSVGRRWILLGGLLLACAPPAETVQPLPEDPLPALGGGLRDSTALACTPAVQPNDGYGFIAGIAPGPGERLLWADFTAAELMLQDATGAFRVIRGRGRATGQFEAIGALGWEDTLAWVSELRRNRILYFTDQGHFVRDVTLDPSASIWIPRPGDRHVGWATRRVSDTTWALVASATSRNRIDTLASFPATAPARIRVPLVTGGDHEGPHPFGSYTLVARSDDGARWCGAMPGNDSVLRLRCVTDGGVMWLDTTLTFQPREVPAAIYDSVFGHLMTQYPMELPELIAAVPATSHLPLVNGLRVDVRGDVWIARSHPGEETTLWVRVRRDGAIRDSLLLPTRMNPRGLRRDTLWVASRTTEQQPVVLRCVADGGSGS